MDTNIVVSDDIEKVTGVPFIKPRLSEREVRAIGSQGILNVFLYVIITFILSRIRHSSYYSIYGAMYAQMLGVAGLSDISSLKFQRREMALFVHILINLASIFLCLTFNELFVESVTFLAETDGSTISGHAYLVWLFIFVFTISGCGIVLFNTLFLVYMLFKTSVPHTWLTAYKWSHYVLLVVYSLIFLSLFRIFSVTT
jgi:hypothetical protein